MQEAVEKKFKVVYCEMTLALGSDEKIVIVL